ncbi:hypothetical protein HPP92_018489 [Vanilla planifolia]|uniref:Dof zinc finger protein n=1 Tax=Vanilla planifolia TaxID=51239 RepID=A0A835Q9Y4_VANPL|nr:hypothetical protein HPP92_018489 [Vanilla planifolia]
MVFSSLPAYIDPPNWNQHTSHRPPSDPGDSPQMTQLPPMSDPTPQPSGLPGPARPISMAERARIAKIPQPEPALKCPRCDSTNTKFCYFNNYSLSQPRHFCKTCRRYWTRGGALRNVPVGGGCRRNKRTKSAASSKPSASSAAGAVGAEQYPSSVVVPANLLQPPPLPFVPPFPVPSDYSATNACLGFPGINPVDDGVDYQGRSGTGLGIGFGLEQWRMQQIHPFPFVGGIDGSPSAGLFPFDGDSGGSEGYSATILPRASNPGLIAQLASVKMEDSPNIGLNLRRQQLGFPGNSQYWIGGNVGGGSVGNESGSGGDGVGWTGDLSTFNSTSSGNML